MASQNNNASGKGHEIDSVWDCMNIASRIAKQIENSDTLVPKTQAGAVTPVQDLQELCTTINLVRTTLVPFVTSAKKSKCVTEASFDVCIKGLKETLSELHTFFKDLEREFSVITWKTQKVKIYQMDFLVKQKLDQFAALFNPEGNVGTDPIVSGAVSAANSKDKKQKDKDTISKLPASALIHDAEARDLWNRSFGEATAMVPWNVFLSTIEANIGLSLKEEEEFIKLILNFTRTDHVSSYEFSVFLKWFGPFKGCFQRMIESLQGGLLCGFVPAVEANLLLEGKRDGTYLIRCSKTQPGSFAVTFVDNMGKVKHCLLYSVEPFGLSLKNPPTVYASLKEFADSHTNKLKHPLGNTWTLKKRLPGFVYDGKLAGSDTHPSSPSTAHSGAAAAAANNNNNGGNALGGDNNMCIVCMDAPFETVFLECGHLACCAACSEKLKLCPICRNTISRVVPIFRAT